MTSPIRKATMAALGADRRCWKEPATAQAETQSDRFRAAYRKVIQTPSRSFADLQDKARLVMLFDPDPNQIEASLARDILAMKGEAK
ncbi:hypothetical protein K6L44_07085 [Gluconacetobacter entanii]|uniref:hypothetical protein n=1 Tax=Gluconacetobacter entanii TaxID=108528 RepID=UPI001C934B1E|nr:hypothetical protein [Gluconacetobacter entanii]MBY4639759.1 hypothetical protein [Gluconacetobacter entanii]MCW4579475.1 hypothetical protein [Gluconacetobacter entanii]MCW4582872.1 hypothetical protein [Gluconacetobacter entanii]MCW4586277.1 hypothetical protein [Gluconacetobacter entanii]